jgi:UDP-GlcNAc:undecaprenyl-phosphate/decaprenyl-phosphate GlcNAc-1-phosphate transferase
MAVKRWAVATDFVSRPVKDRYNEKVTPLGGGIGIFASMAIMVLSAVIVLKLLLEPGYLNWLGEKVTVHIPGFLSKISHLISLLLAIFALFVLGLWDDKKRLGPGLKLFLQFAIAIIAASVGDIRVEFFIHNKMVTIMLSAFWMVLFMNVFNFLDNMDGACAGIAAIVCSVLFVAAALSGQVFVGGLALVLIGTLSGFLVLNFPPARIFMGDAGSLVIGFLIAVITMRITYFHQASSGRWYTVLLPLIATAVPLYDFASVTMLRISQGKSPFVGDTQHFSHRLKKNGMSDRQTVLTLYLATLCTALGAIFLYQVNLLGAILIGVQTFLILAIIAVFETTIKNDKNRK